MKNIIFTIVAVLSTSVCFAETRFEHLLESFANVDVAPCQTINSFYKQRCEFAGKNESPNVLGDSFGESVSQNEARRVYLERLNLENAVHTPK